MTAEEIIVERLNAELASLVGDRIFPMYLPQGAIFPAVTYQRISPGFLTTTRGTTDLAGPRIQIDTWADSYATAKAVSKKVKQSLDGYQHATGNVFALIVGERDLPGAEGRRHRVSQDYSVWHEGG